MISGSITIRGSQVDKFLDNQKEALRLRGIECLIDIVEGEGFTPGDKTKARAIIRKELLGSSGIDND